MGYGDPYHRHPLSDASFPEDGTNCFHCELPITDAFSCYSCTDCDYYIHKWCHDLPIILRHPLHDQHPLTLSEPPSSSDSPDLCNECQNPCFGRFVYTCTTCEVFFHLKCLFTFKHEKHEHPLILAMGASIVRLDCRICGFQVHGFNFGCNDCDFYIHHECSLIPVIVKRHHVHELSLRHNFPEECNQVYCDLCEDRDGEIDPKLSFYYCKKCDYIAHVHCCITQQMEDAVLYKLFTHEHLMRPGTDVGLRYCSQCDLNVSNFTQKYPSLIKHPRHSEHIIAYQSKDHTDVEKPVPEDYLAFRCTVCQFAMKDNEAVRFTHPLYRYTLMFECVNSLFRCDACGELGKGSKVGYHGRFDLHLKCFALPGKLLHKSHENHPLHLRWFDSHTSRYCSICNKDMDPKLWFYFCQECNYFAHLACVANDLLSTFQSSIKNQPDFCAIIEPDKTLFEHQIEDVRPRKNIVTPSYHSFPPVLKVMDDNDDVDDDDDEANCETGGDALPCPKCNSSISTRPRCSTIKDWEANYRKGFRKILGKSANDQILSESELLSFSDEQIIDEIYCSICNVFIFPPTYSCASCQTFFHKSCAELPQKVLWNETIYILTAHPLPEGLSKCSFCLYPITGSAYISSVGGFIFDVQCAARAPLLNEMLFPTCKSGKRDISLLHAYSSSECLACKNSMEKGTIVIKFKNRNSFVHPECGLLPPVINHYRAHQHPLKLATDLAELYDEYVCDVCEKDLNPNLWAYRCVDTCGIRATSHVSCVINSRKKCHFRYEDECQNMTEDQKLAFRKRRQA